jgi:GntR family transcriptional regulator
MSKQPEPYALPAVGNGTLTDQTIAALLDAIFSERFPDRRFPSEPELAKTLNVSRTTLRAALQALERLGIVSRAPGRGTQVLPHVSRRSIALQRLVGFRALLGERYEKVEVVERYWVESQMSDTAATSLELPVDTETLMTSKLYLADGAPAIHIHDEIPLPLFTERQREDLRSGQRDVPLMDSIFTLSKTWLGHEISHTVVNLVPSVAPDAEDFPLSLSPGEPLLVLDETHYTTHGLPVAYSRVMIDDEFVQLQVVRHL